MILNEWLTKVNDVMYTYVLIALLVGAGIYFTICTRGVQFRLLKDGMRSLLEKGDENKMSSFRALMISTASRVGTGNIAGIATAIVAGGIGAVFWMWLIALIGGASAFIESTLAQVYKERLEDGTFRGGPSYYMEKALGKRWMGILFSFFLILCFAYGFNGLQAHNIASSLAYYADDYQNTMLPMLTGLIVAVLFGISIWGGGKRIGLITSILVPVMAVAYILMGFLLILFHLEEMPKVILAIVKDAFHVQSFAGGFAGSAVVIGIKRGLFSNEAGMGSAPNASASADVKHPVQQGLVQIISVFIDTILICSSTAFMLLLSGVEGETGVLDGIEYVQRAMQANVGEWGIPFIAVSIFAFAFSSLIGNYYYAEANVLFIKDSKFVLHLFRITCVLAVFFGAQAEFGLIWNIADVTMGFMAIVNIIAIFLLRKVAFNTLKHYEKNRRNPKFHEEDIGLSGTIWKK